MKKAAIAFLIILSSSFVGCGEGYSHGDRVGTITKFSNKGLFCKTWEGEMNLGGFRTKTNADGKTSVAANIWQFTVTKPELVSQVQEAMDSGKTVRIHYDQWLMTGPCQSESDYFVESVKVLQ